MSLQEIGVILGLVVLFVVSEALLCRLDSSSRLKEPNSE